MLKRAVSWFRQGGGNGQRLRRCFLGVAAGVLLLLVGFTLIFPLWQVRHTVGAAHQRMVEDFVKDYDQIGGEAIRALDGPEEATRKMRRYLKWPAWLAPHKETAIMILGRCGGRALPTLEEAMEIDASEAVFALGGVGEEAIPALSRAMHHVNPDVRSRTATVLCSLVLQGSLSKKGAASAVLEIARGMDDQRENVRVSCAMALLQAGQPVSPCTRRLERGLEDGSAVVRTVSAAGLLRLSSDTVIRDKALRILEGVLEGTDAGLRKICLRVVGELGAAGVPLLPALVKALPHFDTADEKRFGQEAVNRISPPTGQPGPNR